MEKNLADLLSIRIQNDRKMKSDKVTLSLIKSMKFWINFFFLILFCFSFLWALDSEDLEKVKSLKETIEKSDRYRLQPLDLFDGDMHWSIFHGSSYLESLKYLNQRRIVLSRSFIIIRNLPLKRRLCRFILI